MPSANGTGVPFAFWQFEPATAPFQACGPSSRLLEFRKDDNV